MKNSDEFVKVGKRDEGEFFDFDKLSDKDVEDENIIELEDVVDKADKEISGIRETKQYEGKDIKDEKTIDFESVAGKAEEEIPDIKEAEQHEDKDENIIEFNDIFEMDEKEVSEDPEPEPNKTVLVAEEIISGISEERIEALITKVVQDVVERVVRETMKTTSERVIKEAIETLKRSIESTSD